MQPIRNILRVMLFALLQHRTFSFGSGHCGPLQSSFFGRSSLFPPASSSGSRLLQSTVSEESATTPPAPRTRYTIDCPPTKPDVLQEVVTKHCLMLDSFLEHKPIAAHTQEAFDKVKALVPANSTLVLDSGCGTGRSTRRLASMMLLPEDEEYWVLGIDRSVARLERNQGFRQQQQEQEDADEIVWQDDKGETSSNNHALWIRAELVDFWRLLLQHQDHWTIQSHYLLYPNPYPKTKRLKSRWYGHPSFPLILQLGGDKIVVRSNWEAYLEEFASAVLIADQVWSENDESINYAKPYVESAKVGPVRRQPVEEKEGWSNFERKMDKAGEPTFELVLERIP